MEKGRKVPCREQDAKTLPAHGGMKSKSASKWMDGPIGIAGYGCYDKKKARVRKT